MAIEIGSEEECERVHRTLKRIVKARGSLDAQEAAALRDAQRLGLWRRYGYASLPDYMEREMGYSPRAAIERIRVALAIESLPAIATALDQGALPFSGAREITRVATPETEGVWLKACENKNLREVEELVSGHDRGALPTDPPDPTLQRVVLRFLVKPENKALWRQAQTVVERDGGQRLDDDGLIAAVARRIIDGVISQTRAHAPYQIAVTLCPTCKRGTQDGGGITAPMSSAAVERALCDCELIGDPTSAEPTRAKQAIPPTVRRQVLRRDHARCCVPGCRSRINIDIHHIIAREDGGTNDLWNLCCLCEGHHLALHAGTLVITGRAPDLTFTRKADSAFSRVVAKVRAKPTWVRPEFTHDARAS